MYLPSLEEIKRETAKIREGWSNKEELQRSHGYTGSRRGKYRRKPWTIPKYRFSLSRADGLVADKVEQG